MRLLFRLLRATLRKLDITVELHGKSARPRFGPRNTKGFHDLGIGGAVWSELCLFDETGKVPLSEVLLARGHDERAQGTKTCHISLKLVVSVLQWGEALERELAQARRESRLPVAFLPAASHKIPIHGVLLPYCHAPQAIRGISQAIIKLPSNKLRDPSSWPSGVRGVVIQSSKSNFSGEMEPVGNIEVRILPAHGNVHNDRQYEAFRLYSLALNPQRHGVKQSKADEALKHKFWGLFMGSHDFKVSDDLAPLVAKQLCLHRNVACE